MGALEGMARGKEALMAGILKLCGVFLKIGVIFFGGGYVLIPLLHRIMVDLLHWLSLKEFLDGVALSQLTPGPLAMLAGSLVPAVPLAFLVLWRGGSWPMAIGAALLGSVLVAVVAWRRPPEVTMV